VKKAAQVRGILSRKYDTELAEGKDLDELEKLFAGLACHKAPTAKQLIRFRQNRLKKQGVGS
jgi:hypothetical protein